MKAFITTLLVATLVAGAASAHCGGDHGGRANSPQSGDMGNSGFVDNWHGTGSNHQANNEPGDTAADRHGFNNDDAGNSGKNPRENAKGGN
jgi:hypothetical protein